MMGVIYSASRRRGAVSAALPFKTMFYTDLTSGESGTGGRAFYIDPAGSNAANGTSTATAWQSWTAVTNFQNTSGFQPGDRILFKRGGQYTTADGLIFQSNGSLASPIIIGAYGAGVTPVIVNNGVTMSAGQDTQKFNAGIIITAASSYIIIRDLKFITSDINNLCENGIRISGTNITVDNCEVTGYGHGVMFQNTTNGTTNSTVQNCYLHDMKMVVNDTSNPDNDYGCVGVVCSASNVTIRNNTMRNLISASFDYGNDGSCVEIYGTANNILVQNNFIDNTANFTEFGGISTDTVNNVVFDHNIISRITLISYFHNGGGSNFTLGSITNVKFTNNVVYCPNTAANPAAGGFWFSSTGGSFLTVRNNIFSMNYVTTWDQGATDYVHSNNLHHHTSASFRAGYLTGEIQGDPIFVHAPGRDFRLKAGSPALGAGVQTVGYTTDWTGLNYSADTTPDIGIAQGTFAESAATYINTYNWASGTVVGQETVTRPGPATRFSPTGVRETTPSQAMRFDYNPVSPYTFLGIRVEPASTNLLLQSGSPATGGFWTAANATIADSTTAGLDGASLLKTITASAASGSRIQQAVSFAVNSQITLTLYVKRGATNPLTWIFTSLQKPDFSGGSHSWVNLTTGAFGNHFTDASFAAVSRTIRTLNNSVFEIKLTYNTTVVTGAVLQINADSGDGTFAGVLNGTYLYDSAQLEVGAGSAYIPTLGTQGTRLAETLSVPLANGTYNIVVQDSVGQETRSGVVVSNGAYTVTPRAGQIHVTNVSATASTA